MRLNKTSQNQNDGIIALKDKGEREMPNQIRCPRCENDGKNIIIVVDCQPAEMIGIVRCLICKHEMPITIRNGVVTKIDVALPGAQSDKLNPLVPPDIKEDIQEAERAHYNQCAKASVVMCRRVLQLSLIDKGLEEKALSKMLKEAVTSKLLTQNTFNLATSIKGYGDIGAHRREQLESKEVEMVIYATVKMLNELFPIPSDA